MKVAASTADSPVQPPESLLPQQAYDNMDDCKDEAEALKAAQAALKNGKMSQHIRIS